MASWGRRSWLLVCALLPLGATGCFSSSSGGSTTDAGFESGNMPSFALLSASSTNEVFGSVSVGAKSASSSVTITNTGQGASGPITTSITGADASAFAIDSDGCSGTSLPAGGTCAISVHFAPTKSGAASASLSVDASPGGSVDVTLGGMGSAAGSLVFTATSQSFGTVTTGAMSAPTTFTLTNGGGAATGAVTVTLGGADAAQFAKSNDGCSGKPLAPAGKCTVDVRFAPTTTGTLSATLQASDPAGDMAHVDLTGTGASPAAFTVTPASHDFGSLTVGTTSSAQSFTVGNSGGSDAVPTVAVTGTDAADFGVTNGCTAALAPGKTCTFSATFKPSVAMAEGPATVTVSAAGATSGSASLTGTGLAPAAIAISPTTQTWGTFAWGTTSTDVAFTVTNNGGVATGALTVSITGSDAGQFALGTGSTCSGATLAASGGTCTVYAHFAPASPAAGTVQASLTVAGAPGGTVAATISGDAESPASVAFGQGTYTLGPTTVGSTSSPVTVKLVNSGGVPSGVPGAPSITGANAADFSVVTNNCTAAIPAMGGSCTMSVVFAPQTTTGEQATISVSASPGGTAQATLSGMGLTRPTLAITPDPGNTFVATTVTKTSAPVTFTVTNSGQTASSALATAAFSGGNAADFAVVSATDACTGASLAANGGSCTFQVTVTPSVAGSESTTLAVQDGSGDSATDPLSATGLSKPTLAITPDPGSTFATTTVLKTSAPVTFTVTNGGQTASSTLNAPTMSGGNSGDFAVVAGTDNCAGASLAANGGTCTFQVTFTPSNAITESTTLGISDAGGDTATDTLTATGITATAFSLTPDPGNTFQSTTQGQTSPGVVFTLKNSGQTTSGTISTPSFSGGFPNDFAVVAGTDNCAGATLAQNATCTFWVTFTPSTSTTETTTLVVSDATGDGTSDLLTATGLTPVAQLQVTPSSYPFGATVAGNGSSTNTFTINNKGTAATSSLAIQNMTAPFTQTNNCPTSLGAGSSCSMTVTFAPITPGPYDDTVTIFDTASDTATLSLSGPGVSTSYDVLVSPTPGNYGTVGSTSTTTLTFTATNYGETTIPYPFKYLPLSAGQYSADFSTALGTCSNASLAELQSCTFTVTFNAPGGSGSISATSGQNVLLQGQSVTGGPYTYVTTPLTVTW